MILCVRCMRRFLPHFANSRTANSCSSPAFFLNGLRLYGGRFTRIAPPPCSRFVTGALIELWTNRNPLFAATAFPATFFRFFNDLSVFWTKHIVSAAVWNAIRVDSSIWKPRCYAKLQLCVFFRYSITSMSI